MMKILINPPVEQWDQILQRPAGQIVGQEEKVSALLSEMNLGGWEKVRELTLRFDGYDPEEVLVSEEELEQSADQVPESLKKAISLAGANIERFHQSQNRPEEPVEVMEGITCYRRRTPIERVGLYIPGGSAPLFSTVLMLAIPARLAGCSEIILCTPAGTEGKVNPVILYTAWICGIRKVFRLGGVQAVASMAYGLGPVPAVYKIFGPGNSWVTLAKQLVGRDGIAIDMPAGPSELAVIADSSANPAFIAADLLSQAEHGPDSQVLLLTTDWDFAEAVNVETEIRLHHLPRKDFARKSLETSMIIVLKDEETMIQLVNQYAPEHLIIATENYMELAGRVINAGSVFLGAFSPESAGDYASGTNHTLPTSGYARTYSGLSIESFTKSITFQEITPVGLAQIGPAIVEMARAEGLEAHARAVLARHQPATRSETEIPTKVGTSNSERSGDPDESRDLNHLTPHPSSALPSVVGEGSAMGEPVTSNQQLLTPHSITDLVRPNILNLLPYSSARDEFSGASAIFLDANENPYDTGYNRYPDPRQRTLRHVVAGLKGVDPGRVFLGNGSDEAIDLLIRIFCEPRQSRIITLSPSYGMYSVCARIQDVQVDPVLLNGDFSINTKKIIEQVTGDTRIIFLCSPNNPTGNQIPPDKVRQLAAGFHGILVVDEAYIDFASGPSALSLLDEYPNLVVLQTFSKAWGMAGVRMGMAFADPFIISLMDKVKYPYNLSTVAQNLVADIVGARHAVPFEVSNGADIGNLGKSKNTDFEISLKEWVGRIIEQRNLVGEKLEMMPFVLKVYPSEANFLLVKVIDAKALYRFLVSRGIVVRDRSSQPLCENCLRITIGTPEENDQLINAIQAWTNQGSVTGDR